MKKTQYDFFSFETLCRMHKNIFFFFFSNFFGIFKVLTKIRYFNTGFVFLWHKIQTDIKQNLIEKYIEKLQFLKSIFEKKNNFELGWAASAGPCKQWVSPLFTCNVNSGKTQRRRWEREREEGLHAVAHSASSDCGGGNSAASGGWGVRWRAVLASSSLLCRGESLCFFFSFLLLLDELLLLVAMERRRNSGAAGLKVVGGGPFSSPSSSSVFLCFFFLFSSSIFLFFFLSVFSYFPPLFFLSVFFSSSHAPSLVSAPHLPLYL